MAEFRDGTAQEILKETSNLEVTANAAFLRVNPDRDAEKGQGQNQREYHGNTAGSGPRG